MTFGAQQALLAARAQVLAVPPVQGAGHPAGRPCDSKVTRTLERGLQARPQCWAGGGLGTPHFAHGSAGCQSQWCWVGGAGPPLQELSVPGRTLAPQAGCLVEVSPYRGNRREFSPKVGGGGGTGLLEGSAVGQPGPVEAAEAPGPPPPPRLPWGRPGRSHTPARSVLSRNPRDCSEPF